jgi:hypothetical protein
MGYATNGERHIDAIFVHLRGKSDVSFFKKTWDWLRNVDIISGVVLTVALAFKFCGLDIRSAAYIPCLRYCNMFSWLAITPQPSQDVEANQPEGSHSAPVKIVNATYPRKLETMLCLNFAKSNRKSNVSRFIFNQKFFFL